MAYRSRNDSETTVSLKLTTAFMTNLGTWEAGTYFIVSRQHNCLESVPSRQLTLFNPLPGSTAVSYFFSAAGWSLQFDLSESVICRLTSQRMSLSNFYF